jgi:hypothetical protein
VEEFLILILQGILEVILEIFTYGPWDWPWGSSTKWEARSLSAKCGAWLIIGCGLAALSILLLQRTWISHPYLRLLNVVLAPVVSALISQAIARRRQRRNPDLVPRNHFWQAYWFAFGLVVVRYVFAVRH